MRQRWMKPAAIGLGQLLLFLALLLLAERFMSRAAVRGEVPVLQGLSVQGEPVAITDYAGRPVLIYFWASWCSVCALEQGTVNALARDYAVLGVAMQSGSTAEVAAYMAQKDMRYPVLNDPDGRLAERFGVSGVPAGFIVDSRQVIRYVTRGYTTGAGLRARLQLAE